MMKPGFSPFNLFGILTILFLALLAGCSSTPTTRTESDPVKPTQAEEQAEPIPSPSTEEKLLADIQKLQPGDLLVQLDYEPTFSMPQYLHAFGRFPVFSLYSDGKIIYQDPANNYLLTVDITQAEAASFVLTLYEAGALELDNYLDQCYQLSEDEQTCIADGAYSLLRIFTPDSIMKEVRNYAGFANNMEALDKIINTLHQFSHPDAERYQAQQGALFITALSADQVDDSVDVPLFPLHPPYAPPPLKTGETWVVELGPLEIATFIDLTDGAYTAEVMLYEGQFYRIEFVPWLPGNNFSPELAAAYPATIMETSEQHWLGNCPPAPDLPFAQGSLRLVYLHQGDLFVLDENEEPVQLTDDANVLDFILSADGASAFFTRQAGEGIDIWGVDLFKAEVYPLVQDFASATDLIFHAVSEDNEWLPFSMLTDPTHGELWVVRTNGTGLKQLVTTEELQEFHPELSDFGAIPANVTWVPQSMLLVYDALPMGEGLMIYIPINALVDVSSGEKFEFVPGFIEFSPDGNMLVAKQLDHLLIANADGSDSFILPVDYFAVGLGEYYSYPPVAWLPDSKSLYVASPETGEIDYSLLTNTAHILSILPASLNLEDAQSHQVSLLSGFPGSFQFSPGGAMISFWNAPEQSNERSLYVSLSDGAELALYDQKEFAQMLAWSPDAAHFIYTFGENLEFQRIMLGNPCKSGKPVFEGPYSKVEWLDAERFLIEVSDYDANSSQLFLGDTSLNVVLLTGFEWVNSPRWEKVLLP